MATRPVGVLPTCPSGTPGHILSRRPQWRAISAIAQTASAHQEQAPTANHRHAEVPASWQSHPSHRPRALFRPHWQKSGSDSEPAASKRKANLLSALARNSPDGVLRAFTAASKDRSLWSSLPRSTFRAISDILDPAHLVIPYRDIFHNISPVKAGILQLDRLESALEDFRDVLKIMQTIKKIAGVPFGLEDYAYLLKCARAAGNANGAWYIWRDMEAEGVVPNAECYKHYIGAVVWSKAYTEERMRRRVVPEERASPGPFRRSSKIRAAQVRARALEAIGNMEQQGLNADEEILGLKVAAMARAGDTEGIEATLKQYWNIDVAGLRESGEQDSEPVLPYPSGSPLNPSRDLLYAVAHAYGINNDLPTGLMLVDFISRHYEVEIPRSVWEELFEWAFVLSLPRFGERRQDGRMTGQLPLQVTRDFLDTMLSPPYNLAPTMTMLNRHMKILFRWGTITQYLQRMEEGYKLYEESSRRHAEVLQRRRLVQSLAATGRIPRGRPEYDIDHLKREETLARTIKLRDLSAMLRWLRMLLRGTRWADVDGNDPSWGHRALPQTIERYREFLPVTIEYYLRGAGEVKLREVPPAGIPSDSLVGKGS